MTFEIGSDKVKKIMETIDKEEAVNLLGDMIRINTVNEPGNEMDLAKYIEEKFEEIGIDSKIDDLGNNRANIEARLKGDGKKDTLLLNGHLDTVPPGDVKWDYDPFSGEVVDGKIYGRGSADMKGGLAAFMVAMKAIKESKVNLSGDLLFTAVSGEENDSIGAIKFVEDGGLEEVGAIIIGEPCSDEINIAEKGAFWVEISTFGKTAHGSFPEKGINAITHMNAFISELLSYKFKYDENPVLGHPTMNIGTIKGGVGTNVVPDRASITIDMRTIPGQIHNDIVKDFEDILEKLSDEIEGFKGEVKVLSDRPPVETSVDDPFVKLAQEVIEREFGDKKDPKGVNFYTDASVFLPKKDVPCIFYGPGLSNMAHQPNEHIELDNYFKTINFYIAMILEYLK